MFDPFRPRRSVLYMPGSNARALEKAKGLAADALILDLEDAVAATEKAAARDLVADAVREGGYGKREIAIRINGLDTDHGMEDLRAACEAGPDAILIPKAQSAGMIEEVDTLMADFGAPTSTQIWAMMETPLGILHAEKVAMASTRLSVFIMGTNDLAEDLRARRTKDRIALIPHLTHCLLVARSYGMVAIDGVYNAFRDSEGFGERCVQSRNLGFDGKTLIHPSQIDVCNQSFAPDETTIEHAKAQIKAYEEAQANGEGIAVLDGRIVENLHAEAARTLLVRHNAIRSMGH